MTPCEDPSKNNGSENNLKSVIVNGNGNGADLQDDDEYPNGDLVSHKHDNESLDKTTQYLAAAIVTIGAFSAGTFFSWTSSALPLLLANDATIKISSYEGSWVASLLPLGAILGAIPTGLIAERFGRKKTLLSLAIPMIVSWLLAALSTSVYCFYVGRLVGGIALGAVSVAVPPYVAEMAQPSVRSSLENFYQLQFATGILFGYLAGLVNNVIIQSLISATVPVFYFLGFLFMPESPVYLLTQGKTDEAKNSLLYIRGIGCDIDYELGVIRNYIKECISSEGTFMDLIATKANLKALFISFGLMAFQQFSGITAIIFYLEKIFDSSGSNFSPQTSAVIVGVIQVIATFCAAAFFSTSKRRPMLIFCNLIMAASVALLGVFFHVYSVGSDTKNSWIPIVCLSLFVSFYSVGVGPIPWLMLREIFPTNIKRRATAISAGVNWFFAFVITKVYQDMIDSVEIGWVLWNFAMVCTLAAVFAYFMVPETRGKTLEQIQKQLTGNGLQRRHRHVIEFETVSPS